MPFAVEFHGNAEPERRGPSLSLEGIQDLGVALTRLIARMAITGSPLPPIGIREPHGDVPLDEHDGLALAIAIADFGVMPRRMDYAEGSPYRRLRELVERVLGVQHIHLQIREDERFCSIEHRIAEFAEALAVYELAFSQSPNLSFASFVKMLGGAKRVFSTRAISGTLLGGGAAAAAFQLGVHANAGLALEIAAGSAGAYILLKFGLAFGRRLDAW